MIKQSMGKTEDFEQKLQIKRVPVKTDTLKRMMGVSSLFMDELPSGAKEGDILAFFLEKGFNLMIENGEIKKRLELLVGQSES